LKGDQAATPPDPPYFLTAHRHPWCSFQSIRTSPTAGRDLFTRL